MCSQPLSIEFGRDTIESKATNRMLVAKSVGAKLPTELREQITEYLVEANGHKKRLCHPVLREIGAHQTEYSLNVDAVVLSYDTSTRDSFTRLTETYDSLARHEKHDSFTDPSATPIVVVGLNLPLPDAASIREVTSGEARLFAKNIGATHVEIAPENDLQAMQESLTALMKQILDSERPAQKQEEETAREEVWSSLAVLEPEQTRLQRIIELFKRNNIFKRAGPTRMVQALQKLIHLKREGEQVVKKPRNKLRKRKLSSLSSLDSNSSRTESTREEVIVIEPSLLSLHVQDSDDQEWMDDMIRCINEVRAETPLPAESQKSYTPRESTSSFSLDMVPPRASSLRFSALDSHPPTRPQSYVTPVTVLQYVEE